MKIRFVNGNGNNETSFLASQTAVDLIHINVLLSLIPYLPIPTNLITISLFHPTMAEEKINTDDLSDIVKRSIVAFTNPRNSF